MDGKLTQEELDALLNTMDTDKKDVLSGLLSPQEMDAIGEIANICEGSSATSLSAILNQRVSITTPEVVLMSIEDIIQRTEQPCVAVKINYVYGIEGSNIQILQEKDVKVITDLMLGGDGNNVTGLGDELTDLHMSALCEAMNQMTGASATSLFTMLNRKVDISPPEAKILDLRDKSAYNDLFGLIEGGRYVAVCFKLEIGTLVDSSMMQLYSIEFARDLYKIYNENIKAEGQEANEQKTEETAVSSAKDNAQVTADNNETNNQSIPNTVNSEVQMPYGIPYGTPGSYDMPAEGYGTPAINGLIPDNGFVSAGGGQQSGQGAAVGWGSVSMNNNGSAMNVQPVEFNMFDKSINPLDIHEQIDIISDVNLEITVELGKTRKSIKEILDFEQGTLVELDRLAGEMMDILVNGKTVARGEIVVLEDKFAVQLKEIETDKLIIKNDKDSE